MAIKNIIDKASWDISIHNRTRLHLIPVPAEIAKACNVKVGQKRNFRFSFPEGSSFDTLSETLRITSKKRFNMPQRHWKELFEAAEQDSEFYIRVKILDSEEFLKENKNDDLIRRLVSEHCPDKRIQYRKENENKLRDYLNSKKCILNEEEWRDFFRWLNRDFWKGSERFDRFGQTFTGNNVNHLVRDVEILNEKVASIWNCTDETLRSVLDAFWKNPLSGSGNGFPTMLLYLREPDKFNIWLKPVSDNLCHYEGITLMGNKNAAAYIAFNTAMNEFKQKHSLKPQMLDIVLTVENNRAAELPEEDPGNETMARNLIFYGPPGTGKTYNTVNAALDICGIKIQEQPREYLKEKFDELVDKGRIVFTTFHQSMTYEDFIEGIKPVTNIDIDSVTYNIVEGIFCRIAIEAGFSIVEKSGNYSTKEILDFSSAYEKFVEFVESRLEKSEEVTVDTISGGKIFIDAITDHGNFSIKHPGKEKTYTISKNRLSRLNSELGELSNISNMNEIIRSVIGGCNSSAYWALLNTIRERMEKSPAEMISGDIMFEVKKDMVRSLHKEDYAGVLGDPYVLIIDEINRGNISEIFGELITLIEEDKRLGREEAIEVTLPYSKEKFGVPSNLFIIGTMNTADRSIEALDTALRRRFSFVEMLPKPELIREGLLEDSGGVIERIDLVEVLTTINLRIEKLLDADHTIGHSYFLSVETLVDLKKVFHNKIIPLLQEYFFGDIGKIGLVIGKGFFEEEVKETVANNFFADFNDYDTDLLMEKRIHRLLNVEELSDDEFRSAIDGLLNKKSAEQQS